MIHVGSPESRAQGAQGGWPLTVLTGTNDDTDGEGAELGIIDPAGHLIDSSSPEVRDRVTKLNAAVRPSGACLGEKCSQLHE